MIRPIPEAIELSDLPGSLVWELNGRMVRFANAKGPCQLTRMGRLFTLAYFRNVDLSVLDREGDCL